VEGGAARSWVNGLEGEGVSNGINSKPALSLSWKLVKAQKKGLPYGSVTVQPRVDTRSRARNTKETGQKIIERSRGGGKKGIERRSDPKLWEKKKKSKTSLDAKKT